MRFCWCAITWWFHFGNVGCWSANSAFRMHVGSVFFCVEARALFAWARCTTEVLASELFNDTHVTKAFVAFPFSRERWPRRVSRALLVWLYNRLELRYLALVRRALATTRLREVQPRIEVLAGLIAAP